MPQTPNVGDVTVPGVLADLMAAALPSLPLSLKQELLETINVKERLQKLVTALGKEVEVLELGSKIQSEVHSEMSKSQREYYLREQLKAIQKELGEGDERGEEIAELRRKVDEAGMPEEPRKEAEREAIKTETEVNARPDSVRNDEQAGSSVSEPAPSEPKMNVDETPTEEGHELTSKQDGSKPDEPERKDDTAMMQADDEDAVEY